MNENEQEDVADIYEDLPYFQYDETVKELEENNLNLQKKLCELERVVSNLTKKIEELNVQKSTLKFENETLSTNISSLYKTAVAEVARKDNIINELRKENFAYARGKNTELYPKSNAGMMHRGRKSPSHERSQSFDRKYKNGRRRSGSIQKKDHHSRGIQGKFEGRSYSMRTQHRSESKFKEKSQSYKNNCSSQSKFSNCPRKENLELPKSNSDNSHRKDDNVKLLSDSSEHRGHSRPTSTSNLNVSSGEGVKKKAETEEIKTESYLTKSKQLPIKIFKPTFNKNMIVVDKSVPNTIYTKRLRKKYLNEIFSESKDLNDIVKSTENFSPTKSKCGLEKCDSLVPSHSNNTATSTVNEATSKSLSDKNNGRFSDPSSLKTAQVPNVKQCDTSSKCDHIDIRESINCPPSVVDGRSKNDFSAQHSTPKSAEVGRTAETESSSKITSDAQKLEYSNVNPESLNSSHAKSNKKCTINISGTDSPDKISPDSVGITSSSKHFVKSYVKPVGKIDEHSKVLNNAEINVPISAENSLSNSSTQNSFYKHCFKKFKKDGKTRVNPLYIGPRISSQKVKNDKKTINPVSSVLSPYSMAVVSKNVTNDHKLHLKNSPISMKEEKCSTTELKFSLFGATPKKTVRMESNHNCNSFGTSSDTSLSNLTFPSSNDASNLHNQSSSKYLKNADVSVSKNCAENIRQDQNRKISVKSSLVNIPEPVTSKSREEQIESLFGDVSSDSSNDAISVDGDISKGPHSFSGKANQHNQSTKDLLLKTCISKNSLSVMQPKAEVILNFLTKTDHESDSSTNKIDSSDSKTSERNSSNVSCNSSFDKKPFTTPKTLPSVCTPFKNSTCSSNSTIFTPARKLLSPIPHTPQGFWKHNQCDKEELDSLESNDKSNYDCESLKMKLSSSSTSHVIKIEVNDVKKEDLIKSQETSDSKILGIDVLNVAKSFNLEDGNSNSCINSGAFSEKKTFLSPNSISVPSVLSTPFKIYSSDSMQSFIHTPARELLSPIPQTPQGSWDIDVERTNSCDISENNFKRENLTSKDDCALKISDACELKTPEKIDGALISSSNTVLNQENEASAQLGNELETCVKPEWTKINNTNPAGIKTCSSPSVAAMPKAGSSCEVNILSPSKCNSGKKSIGSSNFNSLINDMHSVEVKSSEISTSISGSEVSPKVTAFSPRRSNISENNISISSVSEQIQFQRTFKRVRKRVVSITPPNLQNNSIPCQIDPSNSVSVNKTAFSGLACASKAIPVLDPSRTPAAAVNPCERPSCASAIDNKLITKSNSSDGKSLEISKSSPVLGSKTGQSIPVKRYRRAVLLPTDLAVNIEKNLPKKGKTSSKPNESTKRICVNEERNRSPDTVKRKTKNSSCGSAQDDYESRVKDPGTNLPLARNSSSLKLNVETFQSKDWKKSRVSHRKFVERSLKKAKSSYSSLPSRHNVRSHSITRQRSISRRHSVSKNLGSDYEVRSQSQKSLCKSLKSASKQTRSRNDKSFSNSRSPAKTLYQQNLSATKSKPWKNKEKESCLVQSVDATIHRKLPLETTPVRRKSLSSKELVGNRERTTSANSSFSSISTLSESRATVESKSSIAWKLVPVGMQPVKNTYEILFNTFDKRMLKDFDPRFEHYFKNSDASSVDENEPREFVTSTPIILKKRPRKVRLEDSTQIKCSPVKPVN